eukprot:COSAG02_NODE_5323_length_4438_cov_6.014519_3_plen_744_part_00
MFYLYSCERRACCAQQPALIHSLNQVERISSYGGWGRGAPGCLGATGRGILLEDDAMLSFIRDGFILLDTAAELAPSWHATVAKKAAAVVATPSTQRTRASSVAPAGAAVDQAALWAAVSPQLHRVIHSTTVRGALSSILGNDFVVSGGGHMHEAANLDQFWHRDGSVRGIREHAARGLIVMYYPNGCTLDMGCTAVCRGSQYLTVDRERWPNSEDRLDVGAPPDVSATDDQALKHWRILDERARRVPGMADATAREAALSAPIARLGLCADDAEVRVVVPPGGVLVCHRECYHRATRCAVGARWRPMFKMGASRVCDPVCPAWVCSDDLTAAKNREQSSVNAIVRAHWSWHCGTDRPQFSAASGITLPQTNAISAVLTEPSASETERIAAAYALGEIVVGCAKNSSVMAVTQLLQSFDADAEAVRRAASYGLRAALFTPALFPEQLNPQQQYIADALVERLHLPFKGYCGTVGGSAAVVHVLAAAPMPYRAIATALATFATRTVAELASYTAAQAPELLDDLRPLLSNRVQFDLPLDFDVLDRRLALSETCGALAAVGERAVRAGESDTVTLVARALLDLVTEEEPGQQFPTFFGPANGQGIRMQAAFGLLRLCSDPDRFFNTGPQDMQVSVTLCSRKEWIGPTSTVCKVQPQLDTVAATVAEALRRLRMLCPPTSKLTERDQTQKAREQLLVAMTSTRLPWRRISEEARDQNSEWVLLQHCSTAAPFPAVTELGVQSRHSS